MQLASADYPKSVSSMLTRLRRLPYSLSNPKNFHSSRFSFARRLVEQNMRFDVLKAIVAILSISVLPVATPAPCTTETIVMEVASAADLETMSNAINCTGEGTFHVTWIGSLQLHQSIDISDNKQLTITGSNPVPETVIDGGNATNIVSVSGGSTLNLVSLVLNGGNSDEGGAVAARDFSVVNVVGCSFTNNNASLGGEKGCITFENVVEQT